MIILKHCKGVCMTGQESIWVSFNDGGSICSMSMTKPDGELCQWDRPWVELTPKQPPAPTATNMDEFISSPCTSHWAKSQLPILESRDIVDAISDLEVMLSHFKSKLNTLINNG